GAKVGECGSVVVRHPASHVRAHVEGGRNVRLKLQFARVGGVDRCAYSALLERRGEHDMLPIERNERGADGDTVGETRRRAPGYRHLENVRCPTFTLPEKHRVARDAAAG